MPASRHVSLKSSFQKALTGKMVTDKILEQVPKSVRRGHLENDVIRVTRGEFSGIKPHGASRVSRV